MSVTQTTAPEASPPRSKAGKGEEAKKARLTLEPVLVTVEDVCHLLAGLSIAKLYSMRSSGQFGPMERRIGAKVAYLFREVVAWVEAGMPNREKWEEMKPKSFYLSS